MRIFGGAGGNLKRRPDLVATQVPKPQSRSPSELRRLLRCQPASPSPNTLQSAVGCPGEASRKSSFGPFERVESQFRDSKHGYQKSCGRWVSWPLFSISAPAAAAAAAAAMVSRPQLTQPQPLRHLKGRGDTAHTTEVRIRAARRTVWPNFQQQGRTRHTKQTLSSQLSA